MIKFVAVSIFLNSFFISSSLAARNQDVDPALLYAMRAESLEKVFGPEVAHNAPIYDEDIEDYVGAQGKLNKNVQFVLYTR